MEYHSIAGHVLSSSLMAMIPVFFSSLFRRESDMISMHAYVT